MAKQFTAQDQGKTYRVTQAGQQVGPWVHPAVFSEYGFAAQHPIPDTASARASIDPDTYHDDLIARLVALGHVAEEDGAKPTPVEAGPHAAANQSIKDSVAEHERSKSVRAAAGQEDQRQKAADNKREPAASAQPVVNAEVRTPHRK